MSSDHTFLCAYVMRYTDVVTCCCRKEIPICIVDNESYERDAVFYVELGEPKSEEDQSPNKYSITLDKPKMTACVADVTGEGAGDVDDKIAQLGKPRLGETFRIAIRIKESREFKNTVDKLFQKANTSIMVGTSSWKEQFIEAVTVNAGKDSTEVVFLCYPCLWKNCKTTGYRKSFIHECIFWSNIIKSNTHRRVGVAGDDDDGGDDDEEGSEAGGGGGEKMPSCSDYVMHFFTLFWKVLFAFVPPTGKIVCYQ
ncbi:SLC8A3 [Cordylochernes scorpioides]|uniref:SLC8A3 n=1 Tax=Cordylochernes scorpioides TaxID=51811 RepID=A0ABY6LR19_9ARAC|nr:SLC8A3 [Cordylochernes scorpioides]